MQGTAISDDCPTYFTHYDRIPQPANRMTPEEAQVTNSLFKRQSKDWSYHALPAGESMLANIGGRLPSREDWKARKAEHRMLRYRNQVSY